MLAQTDPDWECWLIDDASPDATGDRIAWWARQDDRIHALRQPTNHGVLVARNRAIAASTGLWIKPLDQDDRLHPHALATIRAAAQVHPDAVGISVTAQAIDDQNQILGAYAWVTQDQVWSSDAFLTANLLGFNPMWVPTAHAYRRAAWAAVGGYRDPGPTVRHRDWGTDWELLWRIATQGPMVTLATVACDYRRHPQQVSHQQFGLAELFMRAQLLTAFFAEHPTLPEPLVALSWGRHWTAGLLLTAHAWQQDNEALALYLLDQLQTYPGPWTWEGGRLLADIQRWMDGIRRHRWPHTADFAESTTLTLLLRTGWAVNPASITAWQAQADGIVVADPDQQAVLASVWPTITSRLRPRALTHPGLVMPPAGQTGTAWVLAHGLDGVRWPLVV